MLELDQKNLVYVAAGITFLTAILLVYLKKIASYIKGPLFWSSGSLLVSIGLLLFALYPYSGDYGAFVMAGSLALTGLCLHLTGLWKFKQLKVNYWIVIGLPLFQFIQGTFFLLVIPIPFLRMSLYSLVNLVFAIIIIFEFSRPINKSYKRISIFGILVFFAFGATMFARLIHSYFFTPENAANTTIISAILFYITILSQVLISFVFIIMFNIRLAEDLKDQLKNREKFFSIIAHDLSGPVGNISEMLKTINHSDLFGKETQKSLLLELEKLSDSTWFLLQNLLEWSRNQLNTVTISKKPIEINALVRQNIDLLEHMAKSKLINLSFIEKGINTCFADHRMVDTILRNVISNAIKFTPTSGIIEISTQSDKNFAKIKIKDNGIGMSPEKKESLFNTRDFATSFGTEGEKGAGLGMILCFDFIKKIEGEFEIKSEEGKGTEIIISLPKILIN